MIVLMCMQSAILLVMTVLFLWNSRERHKTESLVSRLQEEVARLEALAYARVNPRPRKKKLDLATMGLGISDEEFEEYRRKVAATVGAGLWDGQHEGSRLDRIGG